MNRKIVELGFSRPASDLSPLSSTESPGTLGFRSRGLYGAKSIYAAMLLCKTTVNIYINIRDWGWGVRAEDRGGKKKSGGRIPVTSANQNSILTIPGEGERT